MHVYWSVIAINWKVCSLRFDIKWCLINFLRAVIEIKVRGRFNLQHLLLFLECSILQEKTILVVSSKYRDAQLMTCGTGFHILQAFIAFGTTLSKTVTELITCRRDSVVRGVRFGCHWRDTRCHTHWASESSIRKGGCLLHWIKEEFIEEKKF